MKRGLVNGNYIDLLQAYNNLLLSKLITFNYLQIEMDVFYFIIAKFYFKTLLKF